MVCVFVFYSGYPSSNLAEVYNFSVKLWSERTKINEKRLGLDQFKKINGNILQKNHFIDL